MDRQTDNETQREIGHENGAWFFPLVVAAVGNSVEHFQLLRNSRTRWEPCFKTNVIY